MSARTAIVWSEDYVAYDFGPQHPLKPVRVQLTVDLIRACGLLGRATVVEPRPATRTELEWVHDAGYIDDVIRISEEVDDPFRSYGRRIGSSDNPAFPRMHDASALVAGGAIVGAERVWSGAVEHAFVPAGGLHHAMRDHAWGFCIYNDPAIAIRWLLENGASRVAYVDVDVHHGDGVQAAFYDDPRVLTISLHESGNFLFPGTGFASEIGQGDARGTTVNVALPPLTHDDAYRAVFETVVPDLLAAFAPDVLVTQLGCDTHAADPLAHFALTTRTYRRLASMFHGMAHAICRGRWLATGGGGYQIYTVVPRAWTIFFAELCGGELPEQIPPEWIDLARSRGGRDLPTSFEDPPVEMPPDRMEAVTIQARAAADATTRTIFPFFGL